MAQENQNSDDEKSSFIDPVSLTKVTFCLFLIKFDAFEEAKNAILAPSEPQAIVPLK